VRNKLVVAAVSILFVTSGAAAAGETLNPQTEKQAAAEINPAYKSNPFDLDLRLLSVTTEDSGPFRPGKSITFTTNVDVKDGAVEDGDAVQVVEFYRCADSGCDDGSQDEFLGAARWFIDFGTDTTLRSDWTFTTTWDSPNQEGYYAAVAYMYDQKDDEVVSDNPRKVFKLTEQTSTGGGDTGGDNSDSTTPQIVEYRPPTAEFKDGEVVGKAYLENTGSADMQGPHIVEMQVQPPGSGPLSFVDPTSRTCDSSNPENVHKNYQIDSGDRVQVTLRTDAPDQAQEYGVWFLTRDECYGEDGNNQVEPYTQSQRLSYNIGGTTDDGTTKPPTEASSPVLPAVAGVLVLAGAGLVVTRRV